MSSAAEKQQEIVADKTHAFCYDMSLEPPRGGSSLKPQFPDDDTQPIGQKWPQFPPVVGGIGGVYDPDQDELPSDDRPQFSHADEVTALILSCQSRIERLARKYCQRANALEYEELVGIGTECACRVAKEALSCDGDPMGYLYKSIEHDMIAAWRSQCRHYPATVSLDAPLTSDGDFTLHDVVADASAAPRTETDRERAVRDAISRLIPTQQEALKHLYGFEDHGYLSRRDLGRFLGVPSTTIDGRRNAAGERLRRDADLCSVLGVPVVVDPPPPPLPDLPSPEEVFAVELAAWNAGNQTKNKMAKVRGVSPVAAQARIRRMQNAGIIPKKETPLTLPLDGEYQEAFSAWNAGHNSHSKLMRATGLSKGAVERIIGRLRDAGLIQVKPCSNFRYRMQRSGYRVQEALV
jgi:DNA-directed RNA polymerase specialized sigma24 family protein